MRYKDLYNQIKVLTPKQMEQEVKTCGFDRPGAKISELWIVEEDYINPSGDGIEPKSRYAHDPEADIENESVVCKAGTVLLVEDDK